MTNSIISIQESIIDIKSSIKNAKSRHRAATKAYDKAFDSEDEMKQIMYEDKIINEQETIDELTRELEELEDKIKLMSDEQEEDEETFKEEQELEAKEVLEEQEAEAPVIDKATKAKTKTKTKTKQSKAEVKDAIKEEPTDKVNVDIRTSYNTKSGDWPQHSYRVPPEMYEPLKAHIKEVSMFNNLADMSRSLCMGDYDCSIFSLMLNHSAQLATRFIELYEADTDKLSKRERQIISEEFNKMNASTKEQKAELIRDLKSIRKFIQDKELYRFQVKDSDNSSEEEE